MFSLREPRRGKEIWGGGQSDKQKATGVKIVYFVFVFLFNGSMIMLRELQVSCFSMLFIC